MYIVLGFLIERDLFEEEFEEECTGGLGAFFRVEVAALRGRIGTTARRIVLFEEDDAGGLGAFFRVAMALAALRERIGTNAAD